MEWKFIITDQFNFAQFRFYSRDAFVARQDIAIRIHHPLMMKRIIVMMIAMMMMALFKWTVEWVSFLHVPLLHRGETKACEDARIVLTRTHWNIITIITIATTILITIITFPLLIASVSTWIILSQLVEYI